tara:strand:- start:176 stop:544 length:369 start_codon:yes stop_codon:yes gene_type:complete
MNDGKYHPPESNLKRLEIRNPITQGRRAWAYISHDGKLIMSDDGDVWVRHSPEDVFGSKEAAREFAKEQKFRPPPKIMPGSPYDIAPHTEHCCRVIANKPLHNSLSSRLVRWMINSKYVEKF